MSEYFLGCAKRTHKNIHMSKNQASMKHEELSFQRRRTDLVSHELFPHEIKDSKEVKRT